VLGVLSPTDGWEQVGMWNEMMGAHNEDEDCPIVQCVAVFRRVDGAEADPDLGTCPYFAHYTDQTPLPEGWACGDCVDEPACVTNEPTEGWLSRRVDGAAPQPVVYPQAVEAMEDVIVSARALIGRLRGALTDLVRAVEEPGWADRGIDALNAAHELLGDGAAPQRCPLCGGTKESLLTDGHGMPCDHPFHEDRAVPPGGEVERLQAALVKFGRHLERCNGFPATSDEEVLRNCDCGFVAALSGSTTRREERDEPLFDALREAVGADAPPVPEWGSGAL
jgi:hypothetical protein